MSTSCLRLVHQGSTGEESTEVKKPRRSQRIGNIKGNVQNLPSPVTRIESTATEDIDDSPRIGTRTPPSQIEPSQQHSPEWETQPLSQFVYPPEGSSYEVDDEEGEGVWGYLVSTDPRFGDNLVLRRRSACPAPEMKPYHSDGTEKVSKSTYEREEVRYEKDKEDGTASGGYLIGRHPECGEHARLHLPNDY
jgi:serine/threonine-protein kinase CHEK2